MRETVVNREASPLVEGLFRLAELCAAHPETEDLFAEGIRPLGRVDSRERAERLLRWAEVGDVPVTRGRDGIVVHFSPRVSAHVSGPVADAA